MKSESTQVIPIWDNHPTLSWIDRVCLLSYQLSLGEQVPAPVTHLFEDGNYIREMRLPKGSLLTGREHRHGHEMQLLEGSALLIAPDGRFQFDAPDALTTKPGFHAVAIALTDCVARSVHPNPAEDRDIAFLENEWFGEPEPVLERGRAIANAFTHTQAALS